MKQKHIYLTILLFYIVISSCSKPYEKNINDNELAIKFKIEDLSETKLKFGTRAVGLDKIRGFHIIMTVNDRKEIVLYQNLKMNSRPEKKYLQNIVSNINVVVSPNGQHFAISFTDTAQTSYMYHLFTLGKPFKVNKYNVIAQKSGLKNIAWDEIPKPEKIALDFIKNGMKESARYPIRNDELWSNLQIIMPGSAFDELVIKCWPNAIETQYLADSLIAKTTDYDKPFFISLVNKAKKILKNDTTNSSIIHVIVLAYRLGYTDSVLFNNLIRIWPESPTLNTFVRNYYYDFPEKVQTQLIEKSIYYNKQKETYAYKTPNKQFLRDFADSTTLSKIQH